MRHYAGLFDAVNAGKRSVELDLKDRAGRERALALAGQADVLVEGFRPGVMARLGLDEAAVRALNPGLVYCSISGYGQTDPRAALPGPRRQLPGVGGGAGTGGRLGRHHAAPADGRPGVRPDGRLRDLCRRRRPRRQWRGHLPRRLYDRRHGHVDGSRGSRRRRARPRRRPEPVPGYGLFATADGGQVALGVVNEQHFWSTLCGELGLAELARLGFEERCRRGGELQRAIGEAIASGTATSWCLSRRRRRAGGPGPRPGGDAGPGAVPHFPDPAPAAGPGAGGPRARPTPWRGFRARA